MKKLAWVLLGVLLAAGPHIGFSDPSAWVAVKQPNGQYVCRRDSDGTKLKQDYPTKANATQACNGMTWLERELFGTAFALPIPLSPVPTQAGVVNTKCRTDGSCDPAPATLTCADNSGQASMSGLQTGSSYTANVGTYFGGTGKNGGMDTYSVATASGDDATANGWALSGTIGTTLNLTNNGMDADLPGSGALFVRGTLDGVNFVNCGALNWSYIDPPPTGDTTAPPAPVLITTTAGTNQNIVSGVVPGDVCGDDECEGIDHIEVLGGGSHIANVSTSLGILNNPTFVNIGTLSPTPTIVQNHAAYTITAAGDIDGPDDLAPSNLTAVSGPSHQSVCVDSMSVSHDYGKAGTWWRFGGAATDINARYFAAYGMKLIDGTTYVEVRARLSAGGDPTTVYVSEQSFPFALFAERKTGDLWDVWIDPGCDGGYSRVVQDYSMSAPTTAFAGLFGTATSGSGGATMTASLSKYFLNNLARWTYTHSTMSAVNYTAKAYDVQSNTSAASESVTGTPNTSAPSTAKKWHPGAGYISGISYAESIGSCDGSVPVTTACFNEGTSARWAKYDSVSSVSQIGFVWFDVAWTWMEGATAGDYTAGIARMHAEIDKLASQGKRIIIRMSDEKEGSGSNYMKVLPKYLGPGPSGPGDATTNCIAWNNAAATGGNTGITRLKMWDATCLQKWKNLWTAYSWLDNEPTVEAITVVSETSITDSSQLSGYTDAGYVTALKAMMDYMLATFPKTSVSLQLNWMERQTDIDDLAAYAYLKGVALGNVDSTPQIGMWGYKGYLGTLTASSVNYVDKIPWIASAESSELGTHAQPDNKPQTIWDWYNNTMHGSHMAFDRQNFMTNCNYQNANGSSNGSDANCTPSRFGTVGSGGVLDFIIANPTPTHTSCPTRYDTLFGDGSAGSGCNTSN